MKSLVVVWTCDDDQAPDFRKEEREKQNGHKEKVISIGPFVFGDRDTIESVITFRIDGRTIKRGALIGQLDHLVPLVLKNLHCILGLVHNR
jgi:hypothetical protein